MKSKKLLTALMASSLLISGCSTMKEEKKKITLLHEVLHAIFSQLRLDEKINESENLISSLAESLYMFLNENKNFISF